MSGALPLSLIIFFLSGFAALAYQVIWQRLLVIFSGADVYSVTLNTDTFLATSARCHSDLQDT